MPISSTVTTGKVAHASALTGDYQPLHVKVDVSALTNKEVDAQGYLKPNVPLSLLGVPLAGITNEVPCVTIEPIKVHTDNSTLSGVTVDPFVGCATTGVLNRDVMEDVLDRALTTAEIAALNGPNSKLVLSLT